LTFTPPAWSKKKKRGKRGAKTQDREGLPVNVNRRHNRSGWPRKEKRRKKKKEGKKGG